MSKPIGTLGTIDTLTVGGRVYTDTSGMIMLVAVLAGSSRATFRLPTASSGYTVTSGKTLTVNSIRVWSTSSSAFPCVLAYSDNDVGFSSATAFTNGVYMCGDSSAVIATAPSNLASPNVVETGRVGFTAPQSKYLGIQSSGSGYAIIFCSEA